MARIFNKNFLNNQRDIIQWNYRDILNSRHGNIVSMATNESVNTSLQIIQTNLPTTESTLDGQTATIGSSVTMTTLIQKSNLVSALNVDKDKTIGLEHHNIMVAVLMAIFMCISLSIAISIFVFCRKKNSVFMLQKCDQDSDLEMNDINTEVNTSDSDADTFDLEYEVIACTSPDTSKARSLSKSVSSPYEFFARHEHEKIQLSLSNSFPDLSKYAAELSIPLNTKKDQMKTQRKKTNMKTQRRKVKERNKTNERAKKIYEPKGHKNLQEKSTVPLLNSKTPTGLNKSAKSVQTGRKLATHSLSLPVVLVNGFNDNSAACKHISLLTTTASGNNQPIQLSGLPNTGYSNSTNVNNTQSKAPTFNTSCEHLYCIVGMNQSDCPLNSYNNTENGKLFDA